MKRAIALPGLILFIPAAAWCQTPREIADGVGLLTMTAAADTQARNVGWVEFDDHLLLVDGASVDAWPEVLEMARASTSKPGRFAVHTYGGRIDAGSTPSSLTRLVPPSAPASGQSEVFASSLALADYGRRVELRGIDDGAGGGAFTAFVVNEGVLFAGDLVGLGRGSPPPLIGDWIRSLERLERLGARVVVPGRGPTGGPELLLATRLTLVNLRRRVLEAVDAGAAREEVVRTVTPDRPDILPHGIVGNIYDEFVGLRPPASFINGLGLQEGPSERARSGDWVRPAKVVVADFWPGRTAQIGLVAPGVEIVVASDRQEAADAVADADAVLGFLTPEIFDRAQKLRWVQLASAGVERYLATPGFVESDVVLTNAQRLFAPGGAEHVLAMALALSRRLHTAVELQRARRWNITPLTGPTPYSGEGSELVELRGRTLLVVGLGGIGTEVARIAHGVGMRVTATRNSGRDGPPFVEYVGLSSELLALAADADVIVNSVPLTASTEGMFDDEFFRTMKPTAYFINIGRGGTVDTEALTIALRDGRLAGAGLDVTDPEPLPADHALWGLPNVIITPHIGGDSDRHMERIWLLFRENLRRFVNGEPLLSVVDKRRGY